MGSFTKAAASGVKHMFGWFIDDNGFPTGASPTPPSQGATGSGAFNLRGIKTAAPASPEPETTQSTGDDGLIAEFDYESIATRGFIAELAVVDMGINSTILNTTVRTVGELKMALEDIPNPIERNMGFIIQGRAKKQDLGVTGQKGWEGVILPLCTAMPLGRASYDERGAAIYRMKITPQLAGFDPMGLTISSAQDGSDGGRRYRFTSEYPIHLHTWRGSGAIATFNTQHRVISAAKTPVYGNRVLLTTSSVTPATPSVTLSGNPASGAVLASLYEFDSLLPPNSL